MKLYVKNTNPVLLTQFNLQPQLKYRFRDYFFPDAYGVSGPLVGMDDLLEEFTENNYFMKIEFRLDRQKVIAVNQVMSGYDTVEFHTLSKAQKRTFAMRLELRHLFIKKTLSAPEKKDFKMKLPYYLAEELLDILLEYCTVDNRTYLTRLDKLKNDLHQQLL